MKISLLDQNKVFMICTKFGIYYTCSKARLIGNVFMLTPTLALTLTLTLTLTLP